MPLALSIDPSRDGDRVGDILAALAAGVHDKPVAERRVAIVVEGAASAARSVFDSLAASGYRVAGSSDTAPAGLAGAEAASEVLAFADYAAFFAGLPSDLRRDVTRRWGPAERDPNFRPGRLDCGSFAIPAIRAGNVVVLTVEDNPGEDDPGEPPRHGRLAALAWLHDGFRPDAIICLGDNEAWERLSRLAGPA